MVSAPELPSYCQTYYNQCESFLPSCIPSLILLFLLLGGTRLTNHQISTRDKIDYLGNPNDILILQFPAPCWLKIQNVAGHHESALGGNFNMALTASPADMGTLKSQRP